MYADEYYNSTVIRSRTLRDGDGIRNTHNFLKACLIEEHVPRHSHLLDLGCGQGGDLRKLARCALRSYHGIDISHANIEHNRERMARIREFKCRAKLECIDFRENGWSRDAAYEVVSCQFALQYAFVSPDIADLVIGKIASSLKESGIFFGCLPVHEGAAFEQVLISLPGDEYRTCIEYNAPRDTVTKICAKHGLKEILWLNFDEYYNLQGKRYLKLLKRMRAFSKPDPNNAVFVFGKVQT